MTALGLGVSALSVEASRLLRDSAADACGEVSPSVYDTARLVGDASWLTGHADRVRFLLETQHADGTWGEADGYALVPTLAATWALLTCVERAPYSTQTARILRAARAGLAAVGQPSWASGRIQVPDTIAVELVVPALVAALREVLARWDTARLGQLPPLPETGATPMFGVPADALHALRAAAAAGQAVPAKVWHAWETLGVTTADVASVRPVGGALGGSPAATVAWLGGEPAESHPSREYLQQLQGRLGGPVPSITPITYFERAWLICAFASAGLPCTVPEAVVDSLATGLSDDGAPAGPGLPVDSDDTAAVLLALAYCGRPRRPDALMGFRGDGYFQCFLGERTPSITANAHVLETLGLHVRRYPDDRSRYGAAMRATADWLLSAQQESGEWQDKWHASPLYATVCCVQALRAYGGPHIELAVKRAAQWVLSQQRPDGHWGRWRGTAEETSYALQILAQASPGDDAARSAALSRGRAALEQVEPMAPTAPLWHDKDLYAPVRVVRAVRLAALHLSRAQAAASEVP